MEIGIELRSKLVILKALEEIIVEELGAELVSSSNHCYTAKHQTGEFEYGLPSWNNASYDILP